MTTLANPFLHDPFATPGPVDASSMPADPALLERNLLALARTSPRAAELVRSCAPRTDLRFLPTDDGVVSVEVVDPIGLAGPRALASRRHPLREAELLASTIEFTSTAAVAVMGFGAGYHAGAVARRMRRTGIVAIFEPDVAMLRAVLERIDHTPWINESNTVIFTDPDDAAGISTSLTGVEGILMMGLALLEHAPSSDRLGETRTRFYTNFQSVIRAIRTTVATTMVQVETTVTNATRNLPWYVSSPGIAELAGSGAGRPAIVVSAGPSLQRNIDQLARPGVRERFTIIAAQTVLKPLLARGIRPHYVVALDHSEISARFYEGLSAADVEGVTLVIEPKVSAAVPLAFPGDIRVARDSFLDTLLGPGLARDMGALPPGATVAHLACYLARHLGADPVVLVGQDLGFTDGQYYAAGASIHDVWACELNQFTSLEKFEWERIRRMGSNLQRATDHLGRPIYTDEQLATYLVQFERDFQADAARGLTVIDATEGGVVKRHTRPEPLRGVVDRALASELVTTTEVAATAPNASSRKRLRRVEDRLAEVRRGASRIAELSRRSAGYLREMIEHHADQARVDRLIGQLYKARDEVESIKPAVDLVHFLNQSGAFSRLRTDRAIQLDDSLSPMERQKREIERDTANVEQIARIADQLVLLLASSADLIVRWQNGDDARRAGPGPRRPEAPAPAVDPAAPRPHAFIPLDGAAATLIAGIDPLTLTVRRLDRCTGLGGIVVLATDAASARARLDGVRTRLPLRIIDAPTDLFGAFHSQILSARAPAAECWRSGLASTSIYDECLAPEATLAAMEELEIEAALVVGADWCLVDPALCDDVIERYRRDPAPHRLAFSQAPPGLAGCVIARQLLADLTRLRTGAGSFATIGGLLGYIPAAPGLDPVGRDGCARIDPAIRDLGVRLIPDAPRARAIIEGVLTTLGGAAATAPMADVLPQLRRLAAEAPAAPSQLTIELAVATGESCRRSPLSRDALAAIVGDFARTSPRGLLTLRDDRADPSSLGPVIAAARAAGKVTIHIRTSAADATALATVDADIISVDAPANADALIHASRRDTVGGRPRAWVVPRITKSDASYPDLEGFYDRYLSTTGACAIDPLGAARPGERIEPLPLPASARRRFGLTCLYVRADGCVRAGDLLDASDPAPPVASFLNASLVDAWRAVLAARTPQNGAGA